MRALSKFLLFAVPLFAVARSVLRKAAPNEASPALPEAEATPEGTQEPAGEPVRSTTTYQPAE